jgi:hypothetical protein
MRKLFQFSVILILSVSCSTTSVTTTNLRDLASFEPDARIYALPQTRLVVTAIAERITLIPGPYNKYAKEFLGIDGAESLEKTSWNLVDLKLSTLSEPDPEQFYSVRNLNTNVEETISKLTGNGLLLNACVENNFQLYHTDYVNSVEEIPYTDLSSKSFFFNDNRKKPKNVLPDSAYALFPTLEKHIQAKSEKEKAFEAAQYIFKIRKRRFKLISGQYDTFPEGTALQSAVIELNKLEKEYLSLFIGKTYTDSVTSVFSVVPSTNEDLQRFTVFRFSTENGFFASAENEGTPIILELKDLNQNEVLNQLRMPTSGKPGTNNLVYRLPDKTSATIFYDSHVLLESELPVFQLGAIVPMFISGKKR